MTYTFKNKYIVLLAVVMFISFINLGFLEVDAATPIISSISPQSVNLNSEGFYITIIGSNFEDGLSRVQFNGSDIDTFYISSTQLKAYIPSSDLTTAGNYSIKVVASSATSNTTTFSVKIPLPKITSIFPVSNSYSLSYTDDGLYFNLTINGTGFIPFDSVPTPDSGSTIKFDNQSVVTKYLSQTQLIGEIPISVLGTSGNYTVIVTNPSPAGDSNSQTFTVSVPAPTITSVSQNSQPVGTPGANINVVGTNFTPTSVARYNGLNRKTTYISSTSLDVQLTADDLSVMGYYQLNILNPDGKTSNNHQIRIYKMRYDCDVDTQQCQQSECSIGDCKDLCTPLDNGNISCYDTITIVNRTFDYYPYSLPGPDADFWYIVSGYPAPANPWVLVETRNGWGSSKIPVFKNAVYTIIQKPPNDDDWQVNLIQGAKVFKVGNQGNILAATNIGPGGTVFFTNSYVGKGKLKIVLRADGQTDKFDFLIQHSKNGSYFYDWTDKNLTVTTTESSKIPNLEQGRQEGEKETDLHVDTHIYSDESYIDYKVTGNLSEGWTYDSITCQKESGESVGKRDGKTIYAIPIELHKTTTCYFDVHQNPATLKIITNLNGNIDDIKNSGLDARPLFSYSIAGIRGNNSYYPLPYYGQVQITNFPEENASTGIAPREADAKGAWAWGSQEISINSGVYYIEQNSTSGWIPSSPTCFQVYQNGQTIILPPSPKISYVCYNQNTSFATCQVCNEDWCRNNESCNPNVVDACNSSTPPPPSTSLATFNQKHFKIYRDNYILNGAQAYAPEDTNFNVSTGLNFRIRFQVANTGTGAADINRRLEFKEDFGPWTQITTNSNNVRLVDSVNFIDGAATTSRLSPTGTFTPGTGKDTSSDTGITSLVNGNYIEDEYALVLKSTAVGHNYYFRITNLGIPLDVYSATPYISVSSLVSGSRIFTDEKGYIYQTCQSGDPQNSNENNCCVIKNTKVYKNEQKKNVDYGNPESCSYVTWGLLNPLGLGGRYVSQFNIPSNSNNSVIQVPIAPGGKTICIFNNTRFSQGSAGRPSSEDFKEDPTGPNEEIGL